MITLVLIPALPDAPAKGGENSQAMQTQNILAFERSNPLYSINVYKGTDFAGLGLPDTLRVIEEVDQQEAATFVQQQPQADANASGQSADNQNSSGSDDDVIDAEYTKE